MLGNYFYHEIIRKTIIGFGTLFNGISIKHKDEQGQVISDQKVALAYGPAQKFLARIDQQANLNKAVQITLPRMSFEMTSLEYDSSRKAGVTQTFKSVSNSQMKKVYMPVPYNIGFQLNIFCKLNDDALQIIEQILPYFQPSFNITINLIDSIGEKRDVPIILNNISMQDDYEGDFSSRRALIYTLNFTAKTYLFGGIADSPEGLIKKVTVDTYSSTNTKTAKRQMRYVVTPKAKKDYNDDQTGDLTLTINDTETLIPVVDSSNFEVGNRIIIDNEIMYVESIPTSTQLYVERGYDSTVKATHLKNAVINLLTAADDALIEPDDDFGFNESFTYLGDSKAYSPTRQIDI
tara:strand:- start:942 stop:1988 length:1047 start_codon:yes stop_codon:yes gene_type:complete